MLLQVHDLLFKNSDSDSSKNQKFFIIYSVAKPYWIDVSSSPSLWPNLEWIVTCFCKNVHVMIYWGVSYWVTFLKSKTFWILGHVWPPKYFGYMLGSPLSSLTIFAIDQSKEYTPARFYSQNDLYLKNLFLNALQKTPVPRKTSKLQAIHTCPALPGGRPSDS